METCYLWIGCCSYTMSSDDDQDVPNGDVVDTPPKAPKISRPTSSHPKYVDMLIEAIKVLDEKKGASVIAIKHWINNTYPELGQHQATVNSQLRKAIKRAYDSGQIVRPKKSENDGPSLTGRFKLGKPPKPAKKAQKKKMEKKKAAADAKKKKSSAAKKDRKKSEDIFDFANDQELENDTEGSDPDGMATPPPYKKSRAKKEPVEKLKSKKVVQRPRSASANATPKPRVNKSKALLRRSKSQSPAPSKISAKMKKKPTSKSPARKGASKSPAKKATSKAPVKKPKPKTATSKSPSSKPAKKAKAKEPADKKKAKPPAKKATKGKEK